MTKIPVGATIAQAYRFAFKDFFTIVGIVWLPWAIMSAAGLLVMRQSMALPMAVATRNFTSVGVALLVLVPFYLLMILLLTMMIVGITQQVLGLRQGSPYYYFSLGKPIWRLIGAFLLLFLLIILGYVIVILLGIFLAFLAKLAHLSGASMALAAAAVALVSFCAYIYALVRVAFLLVPVAIAEERISLGRSWALGRGNFWRMFVILLSILVPIMAVELIFMFGFLFHGLPPVIAAGAGPTQQAAAAANVAAWNAAMMGRMTSDWYITYPLFIIWTILFYGLSAGAQAFAYRALVPAATADFDD